MTPAMTQALQYRRQLYDAGMGDAEIARATGAKANTVTVWRRKEGLPSHVDGRQLSPTAAAKRLERYNAGWSDQRIASVEGVFKGSIFKWRQYYKLPPNFAHGVNELWKRQFTPGAAVYRNALYRHVAALVPRFAPDVRDDMIGDAIVAVLERNVGPAEIRKIALRTASSLASVFGPRSLDEQLGDDDGRRMIDLIRDDRSSSWLEEMGATVW